MCSEQVLVKLAKKTPCYAYDLSLLTKTLDACKQAAGKYNFKVHYALKANNNRAILESISRAGFGADCVSGPEIKRALSCGFKAKDTVFAGVGKSDEEIIIGLKKRIFSFNVESEQELQTISDLAEQQKRGRVKIALRINPEVDGGTHAHITTGLSANKFGINQDELPAVLQKIKVLKNLDLMGLHFHIGSQITDLDIFKRLCERVNYYYNYFKKEGCKINLLNVGGGLGVNYEDPSQKIPNFEAYFAIFAGSLSEEVSKISIHFELGRSLVAACGTLFAKVLYVKQRKDRTFLVLNAGMTELLRPALYGATHRLKNLSKRCPDVQKVSYDVVGPICESTDCFGKQITLPLSERGDLIAIHTAGAYGQSMALNYNLRPQTKAYYDLLV